MIVSDLTEYKLNDIYNVNKIIKAIFLIYYKMLIALHIAVIIAYILLLFFAISLLLGIYLCDNYTCDPFKRSFAQPTKEKQLNVLIDTIGNDGVWPYAYLASSILSALLFSIIPVSITIKHVTTLFLLIFLIIYSIMSFYIHHYIIPIKKYVQENK